jgi:hypothetical protein
MRRDDSAVATVVGALLVLAALVSFLVVYNLEWAPVFVENREGEASAAMQAALVDWGTTAENYVGNGYANRTFAVTVPVGASTGLLTGGHRSSGTAHLETGPALTVFRNATQVADASGALRVDANFSRYPSQTMRYAFGALEVTQASSTWVDLRGLLSAQRGSAGALTVGVQAIGVSGGPQAQGGGTHVDIVGTVESATAASSAAGTVRLLVENVHADAWRAAFTRVLSAASLTGETAANCSASAQSWCFDSATNTATTADLYLRNVAGAWTTVSGTVRVELRT